MIHGIKDMDRFGIAILTSIPNGIYLCIWTLQLSLVGYVWNIETTQTQTDPCKAQLGWYNPDSDPNISANCNSITLVAVHCNLCICIFYSIFIRFYPGYLKCKILKLIYLQVGEWLLHLTIPRSNLKEQCQSQYPDIEKDFKQKLLYPLNKV